MRARRLLTIVTAAFVAVALLAAPASAVSPRSAAGASGTIAGEVTIESDGPYPGMRVSAEPFAGGAEVASDLTDEQGRYTLTVPPGEYLVTLHSTEFRYPGTDAAYFPFDHYAARGGAMGFTDRNEEAQAVSVTDGEIVEDLDILCWPAMGFDGQLVARDPSLLRGLVVTLYEKDGTVNATRTVRSKDIEHGVASYSFGRLRQGKYRIGLRKGGVVDEPNAGAYTVIVDTGNSQLASEIRVRRFTTNTSRPRVSSTSPRVGAALTASVGGWTRTQGVTWRYRWYANGKAIKTATRARYTPTVGTLGKRLSVRVTAVNRGEVLDSAVSAATKKVTRGRILVVTPPSLTAPKGAVVGRILGRDLGRWTPKGLTWRYQWLRNGKAISGQRGRTYRLRSADWGKRVSVRVTASRKGFHAKVRRTGSVLVKRASSMRTTTTALDAGRVRVKAKVRVTGLSRPSGRVDVLEDGAKVATIERLNRGFGALTIRERTPGAHRYTLRFRGNRLAAPTSRTHELVVQ